MSRTPQTKVRVDNKCHFRKLTKSDAQSMCRMEKICFSMPWTLEQCEGALTQKSFVAYGLWRADKLLAYISFYHSSEELEIVNLAVLPEERRKGYGKRILYLVLQVANKMGMQKVLLEVRQSNLAAITLYEKSGFRQCGIRPRYYSDRGEDALVYNYNLKQNMPGQPAKDVSCKK